jgi:hypothetical protein
VLPLERLIGYGCIGKKYVSIVRMKQINKNLLCEKSLLFLLLHLAVQVHVLNA